MRAQPACLLVRRRHLILMAAETEIPCMTGIARRRFFLSGRRMLFYPVLRMNLVTRMTVRTKLAVVALIAGARLAVEFGLVLGHPAQLVRAFELMTIGTVFLRVAELALLPRFP